MAPQTPNRRASDNRALDIEELIAAEDDTKARAILIVLNSINNSLVANTKTIIDVSDKLDEHLTLYEQHTSAENERLNQGRGAWKVAAWVLGIAQMALIAGGSTILGEIRAIHTVDNDHTTRIVILETKAGVAADAKAR